MVSTLNRRNLKVLLVAVAVSLTALACNTEQVPFYLTPTQQSVGDLEAPGPTVVPATELSAGSEVTLALEPTETSVPPLAMLPENSPVPAPTPEPTPPAFHFLTSSEALNGATELGCTGWVSVTVDGISYSRACANDEMFESLVTGAGSNPTATNVPDLISTSTPTIVTANPTPVPTTRSGITSPPPYHYATAEEAIAGSKELGCSGWSGTIVDGVSYFRACGSDRDFELLSLGAGVTLSGEPCTMESDPTARFNSLPTDLSKIASIVPSGSPAGGVIKPHSYLHNRNNPDGTNVRVPVYAVADSLLTSIAYYGTTVNTSEYLIFFDVTCEISFKYDHISEVVPKLAAVAPATPSDSSATSRTAAITFEAGELIGYSVGAGGFGAWDFGAYDLTYTNRFANQERYEAGYMTQSLHTVCPYDYFEEPLKSEMYALFGTHDQRLLPNIECTTTERDVPGAASGAWFDSLDFAFSQSKVSMGVLPGDLVTLTGIGNDVRIEKGQPTWLDPALLTTSHCYVDDGRWFFIEIRAEGMQMALANGSGSCPVALPSGATVYYR